MSDFLIGALTVLGAFLVLGWIGILLLLIAVTLYEAIQRLRRQAAERRVAAALARARVEFIAGADDRAIVQQLIASIR